ncbi:SLC13 family permease [Vulgatibacter sp.]|uniref:SLC13 family permease n=1 Tax=Vulgatibacter sp. TaxID=1971226 RepID=UPI00356B20D7
MSLEAAITLVILAATIALFVSDRIRLDVVALLAMLALVLTGVLSTDAALAGFSSPLVLMIVGLFVVGAGLVETGVTDWLGQRLGHLAKGGEARLIVWVILTTAVLSAFMSSTGTVAILMPVVGSLAHRKGIAPGRIFLPLAFGAHLGSMLTLISTPPNLVASNALVEAGEEPFRFFSFFPPGFVILCVGVTFLAAWGRRLLPGTTSLAPAPQSWSAEELAAEYGLAASLRTLRVPPRSPLCGKQLGQANLRAVHHVNVIGIEAHGPGGPEIHPVLPQTVFAAGEVLRVQGDPADVEEMARAWELQPLPGGGALELPPEDTLAEVVVPRRSSLVGRTLREVKFRDRYRATALAVRRATGDVAAVGPATPALLDFPLRVGDTLLLKGRRKHLRNLRDERRDLILVAEPDVRTDVFVSPRRAWTAIAITLAMLLALAFGWLPNVIAVLLAAVAMVLTRCVRPVDSYRSVNWESVVLIAAMLPMATALEQTGLTRLLVVQVEGAFAGAAPLAVLAAVLVVTSGLGMVMSNTATAVLVAPVAVRIAEVLELSPRPLLMGVAIAASAAFATPIASPVNTIVMGPGGYRFADFVRVGLPLQVIVLLTALVVVPLVFPF